MRTVPDIETALGRWAIDELLERYISWREECDAVVVAYRRFADSRASERRLAYAGYLAALDHEEHAARLYADHIERVARISHLKP
jgi:hypothetical protein